MKKQHLAAPPVINIVETANGRLKISYPPLQKKYNRFVKFLRQKLQASVAVGDRIFTLECDLNNPSFLPCPDDELKLIQYAAKEALGDLLIVLLIR